MVVLLLAVALAAAYFGGFLPFTQEPAENEVPPAPYPDTTPSPMPSTRGSVDFDFTITEIRGSGLSRDITALITNTGKADAHNVWAKMEVFSGDSRVRLGGQDYLRVDIGTIGAGESIERQVTLSFTLADGLTISRSGATFKLTINSDEHSETYSYDYSV